MKTIIRFADCRDANEILKIYAPYVTDTCVSFEIIPPTEEEYKNRIKNITSRYPFLVCECDGEIVGYAYATKHRERSAYIYSVDVSVYISPQYHRNKIGSLLYNSLLLALHELGYYTAYAGISLSNDKSVAFHKSIGFHEVGVYHNVGYKLGKWQDVIWLEKSLRDYNSEPGVLKNISELTDEVVGSICGELQDCTVDLGN